MTETQVQTRRGRIIAVLVGVAVTLGLSAGMEFFALKQNQRLGKQLPFLYSPVTKKHLNTLLGEAEFTLLDPLLGYAHSDDEGQQNIYMPHSYLPGFIAYGTETPDSFERPIIVTLGGSTTDPVSPWGISWPEQLARYLAQNKLPGTVINGGVGGYSSSQELFKLIRDVIELKPDILITYNGANDVGNRWAELPHPMIHTYQRRIFDHVYVDQEPVSQILPNTILYLRAIMRANPSPTPLSGITYGIKTSHSSGSFLVRNIDLVHAVASSVKISHISVLQPAASEGKDVGTNWKIDPEWVKLFHATSEIARRSAGVRDFMYDFTEVLNGEDDVYLEDGVHLTSKGNAIIAKGIYDILRNRKLVQ